jgi:hypothetical protein
MLGPVGMLPAEVDCVAGPLDIAAARLCPASLPGGIAGIREVLAGSSLPVPPQPYFPPPVSTQASPFGQYWPLPQQIAPDGAQVPSRQSTG